MSGSNGRQMLNSGSVSSMHASTASALTAGGKSAGRSIDRKHRKASSDSRIANNRRLLVENLERREMMASDTAAYYNPLISTDVNGDFNVTPLDALLVINALNTQSLSGVNFGNGVSTPAEDTSSQMIDVNGDGSVSAIDALLVINQLNEGEGETGILVGVETQILSSTGVVQVPDANGNYTLSAGSEFTLRVRGQDRRPPPPPSNADTAKGLFSFFTDINYSTVGSPDTELAQVLWGETQRLSFSDNLAGGSFTLDFGGQPTGSIAIGLTSLGGVSSNGTINNIRNAVGALSFVGGVNNLDVTDVTSSSTPGQRVFQIRYIGPERRTDQPNPVFVASGTNLTSTNSSPVITSVTTSTDPSSSVVFAPAVTYPSNAVVPGSGDPVVFRNSPSGRLVADPGVGFRLDDIGGIGTTGLPNFVGDDGPNTVVNIFDTAFRSSSSASGSVEFNFDVSGTAGKDILLLGSGAAIPAANIAFPAPFRVQFVQSITANNVSSTVNEDSGANNIAVTATLVTGTGFTVESVTQPASGTGTASFLPSSRTVVFTPAANYSGPATFTYTVISNVGDRSTANVSVSVTAVNDAPTLVPGVNLSIAEDALAPLVITPSQIFSPGPLETTQAVTFGVPALVAGKPVQRLLVMETVTLQ